MRTLALIATAILLLSAIAALAHGDYIGKTDPAYNNNCCGGSDCATAPTATVSEGEGGFHVVMTLDEARTVNPLAMLPIAAVVPWGRVQPSWDGDFHICIFPKDRSAPRGGVICFWAPLTT
jgi:hypothetical protein